MFRKFSKDVRGHFSIMTAITIVPILGGVALAIDMTEMFRQRQATLNALDAAGIATARRIAAGNATDDQIKLYAQDFFEANLGPVNPADTTLVTLLPNQNFGGGTLVLTANLTFKPWFYPAFATLLASPNDPGETDVHFSASTEVRLKNTLEVALVLDNSGSMDIIGTGSGKKRLVLLKEAAKQLVDTISKQAEQMKRVVKPVQFGLVPFAGSVNVGPTNATASWMDTEGRSPVHHQNFGNWASFTASDKKIQLVNGAYYKKGAAWGAEEDDLVTRFTLFDEIERVVDEDWISNWVCVAKNKKGECTDWDDHGHTEYEYDSVAKWEGCVETRPSPYNITDEPASYGNPATMFVPMFAPDETDQRDGNNRSAYNNWWRDVTSDSSAGTRQRHMPKYFEPAPLKNGNPISKLGMDEGPNASCSTKPITPLVDVSDSAGVTKIKNAIDAMISLGATNVPEGMAWGWRVVSGGAPFTEGRPDTEKGNDKVVIVLTDGANTYYTPQSLGANDLAGNKSIYSAYGYTGVNHPSVGKTRLFVGTNSINATDFSNGNYTAAMNQHFAQLCANAKAAPHNILVMTVSLDLDINVPEEKKQIEALTACASESRYRKDANGNSAKLFWNATGGNLAETFKKIADELSNLRIVS
jgi:Flp pilus assembly protein TadG